MNRRTVKIVEELRSAVRHAERAGMTRYAIAKATGLSQAMLSRFMAGQNVPKLDTAERIARAVGRRLTLQNDT